MEGFLTYGDGRLKAGRISFLALTTLLACAWMIFSVSTPLDRAMVAVKHVFEAQEATPAEQNPVTVPDEKVVMPLNRKEIAEQSAAAPVEQARPEPDDKAIKAETGKAAQAKPPGDSDLASKADTLTPSEPESENVIKNKDAADEAPEAKNDRSEPKIKEIWESQKQMINENPHQIAGIDLPKEVASLESTIKNPSDKKPADPETDSDKDSLSRLAAGFGEEEEISEPPKAEKLDVSKKLSHVFSWAETPEKREWPRVAADMGSLTGKGSDEQETKSKALAKKAEEKTTRHGIAVKPTVEDHNPKKSQTIDPDPDNRAITVDGQYYMKLFHGWRRCGDREKVNEKIPLQVENLRSAYDLFQMKPVAVLGDNTFIDLGDGTRVPERALEEYSSTVFLVDEPWEKWGDALESAGVRRSDKFEVRYYMYDFIRNAIFTRANQVFDWLRAQGRIGRDVKPDGVDVLGRAYVIKRKGGGRFGVFVPVSVNVRDGRVESIDPACFAGQADIEALRTAGLL